MPTAATVPMAARRWEPCVRTIRIRGLDLTPIVNKMATGGLDLLMQVRLAFDTPGAPLVNLPLVATANTEGLRVTGVAVEDGVPVSTIELRINEPTMEGLPFSGEVGDPSSFYYGLQVTFGNLKKTRMEGQFIVLPGAVGSDSAPLDRPASYGSKTSAVQPWSSADLTIANDEVIQLEIDGAAEIGALVAQGAASTAEAKTAASQASAAAIEARAVAAALSATVLGPTGKGLLFKSDGTLSGWTGDGAFWASNVKPALISYNPSAVIAQAPGAPGTSDAGGVREGYWFQDTDGTWYIFYGAGNGSTTDPGGPWRPQYAKSTDKGLSWTKMGEVPGIGLTKGFEPGNWAARDMLFVYPHTDGNYYLHTLTAATVGANQVCGQPYTSDVWKASNINGPYTFVRRTLTGGPAGRFDALDQYASCLVPPQAPDDDWQLFFSATPSPASEWYVGRATGPGPAGPFTVVPTPVLPDSIRGQDENPEVFWHPGLSKWVMLTNSVNKALGGTDTNRVYFSDSLTDWSNATVHVTQRISPMDGATAIGHSRPKRVAGYGLDLDALGNVPLIYDTDPTPGVFGNHTGRRLKYAWLEPSSREMAAKNGGGATYTTAFADDFSTETAGDLGGQNGWVDGSGNNAKPQVTAGGRLDMRSTVGPSLVYRAANIVAARLSATLNLGPGAGVGFAVGYAPGAAHFRFDFGSASSTSNTIVVVYVDPDGTEHNLQIFTTAGLVPANVDVPVSVTINGGTITISSNGKTVTYVEADTSRLATLKQTGGYAIRNGFGVTGARIVDNYKVQTATTTAGIASSLIGHALDHSSFVADFAVRADTVAGTLDFFYRASNGDSADDCYLLTLNVGGVAGLGFAASLSKVVAGEATVLATSSAASAVKVVQGLYHRVTVSVQGQRHVVSVDGEQQLVVADTTFGAGQFFGFRANGNADLAVRGLTIRESNRVVVNGVAPGQVITLRGPGYIPLASGLANGTEITLTTTHFPASSIDADGENIQVPYAGAWGGQVFG